MKLLYSILMVTLFITSCSGDKKQSVETIIASDNLEAMRLKRAELVGQQQNIAAQLKQLDDRIRVLDTVKNVPLVTTFKLKKEVFKHYLELQGNVNTKNLLVLYPEYNGVLTKVYVKEGQKVRKGEVLAKIDDGGLSQQLAQAEIQTNLAKTTFERQERLWNQKIGSEIQYLQAKSNYEAQAEAVNQIKQQIAKTVVRAPFSGIIDDVITDQGSVVNAGQTQLMRIVNLSDMYIKTDVPESYLNDVTVNKNVKVEFPVLGKTIDSKIRQVGNFINPANRTFKIEVAVPNKNKIIKPNLTARLKINDYTNEEALLVPLNIISENANGDQYIYVVNNKNGNNIGVAERVIIETGRTQGDIIEVLEGVNDGAEVVKEGARTVKNGQTVKVLDL
ncbi:efflux RND transporter periplasmic adaptor subunit [Oceanihabitans sp. IOP_32]|uniref:efflux RND transporter periplasmic adaptor subunit n=1 Tax=Oceanihabitans sp. IOP_32 TaxID=2529032 RepID=UPI00129396F7|nr:efflux RND transporter periplasmic adaptor subunit [Oceanihabitans sp. IOP_32]QFZ54266.1 efflux RND transporter periplasmic adaptor subunit [Oceanihabitans sp. IOP_32]